MARAGGPCLATKCGHIAQSARAHSRLTLTLSRARAMSGSSSTTTGGASNSGTTSKGSSVVLSSCRTTCRATGGRGLNWEEWRASGVTSSSGGADCARVPGAGEDWDSSSLAGGVMRWSDWDHGWMNRPGPNRERCAKLGVARVRRAGQAVASKAKPPS